MTLTADLQVHAAGYFASTQHFLRQLRQMTRLIDDLLDVSRISRGKLHMRLEQIDLLSVVNAWLKRVVRADLDRHPNRICLGCVGSRLFRASRDMECELCLSSVRKRLIILLAQEILGFSGFRNRSARQR